MLVILIISGRILFDHYFAKPGRVINKMDTCYMATKRNMSYEEVIQLMGPPHRTYFDNQSEGLLYWDDDLAPLVEGTHVTQSIRYTVKTFFLPVSFHFYFDSENRLVGRHRFD